MRVSVKTIILLFLMNIPGVTHPIIPAENLVVPVLFLWSWLVKPRVVYQPATASVIPGDPYRLAEDKAHFKLLSWGEFLRGKMKEEKDSIINDLAEANGRFAKYWTVVDTSAAREAIGQRESALKELERVKIVVQNTQKNLDDTVKDASDRLDKLAQERGTLQDLVIDLQSFSMQTHYKNETLASQLRNTEEERVGARERVAQLDAALEQKRVEIARLEKVNVQLRESLRSKAAHQKSQSLGDVPSMPYANGSSAANGTHEAKH